MQIIIIINNLNTPKIEDDLKHIHLSLSLHFGFELIKIKNGIKSFKV